MSRPRTSEPLPRPLVSALALSATLLLLPLTFPAAALGEDTAAFDARAAFEALKQLEGSWEGTVALDPQGEGRPTEIVYKVSAAGHSVIETFAPGAPHEMFSVYHLDGDQLLMTHYCAIGNAPKMRFVSSDEPGSLRFEFAGGTNLDPAVDAHAHEGSMRILGPDEIALQAVGYRGGEPSSTQYFSMRRKADGP